MIEAIQVAAMDATQAAPSSPAMQSQASAYDVREFAAALERTGGAQPAAQPAATQAAGVGASRNHRMRIALSGHTMRGPAGVGDAGVASNRIGLLQGFEFGHLALGAAALHAVISEQGDAG